MLRTKQYNHIDYFNKIKCPFLSVPDLNSEEQFTYLQKIFQHHIQEFPFHNFELRETSRVHPLCRSSLTLFKMNDFIEGYNGGFCFQTTQMLYTALTAAGFNTYCSIAKVLNGLSPDSLEAKKIPATHLVLVVKIGEKDYLLDPSIGMTGHCSPFLIPDSNQIYEQKNHRFKLEKNQNEYLFYREINGDWSLAFSSALKSASMDMIKTQLTKLGSFPIDLGIRDIIILVGIATPNGGKSLLWHPKNRRFTYKIINSEGRDKEEVFADMDRAYALLHTDFKIEHVSKLEFKQYCDGHHWPKLKESIDVNFPIDQYEMAKIKRSF